jgi:Aspartyl protease
MPAYHDGLFSPPAPVAAASLRNPESSATLDNVLFLIDSGADVTLLPEPIVSSLGLHRSGAYELAGFDGSRSIASAVRADLLFLKKTFRGQFLLIDQEIGILGRDILNSVAILLDGPRLVWEEKPAAENPH